MSAQVSEQAGTVTAGALSQARAMLEGAGVGDPGREALAILAGLRKMGIAQAWSARDAKLTSSELRRFLAAAGRRAAGEPLAYVVGRAGFRLLDLRGDRKALIPRPETEGLIDHVLAWGRERDAGASWGCGLDLGTGSGCLALSMATEGRFERVVATDVSRDALAVAQANTGEVAPATPLEFRQGSWFEPVAGERFDVIVSNPPYVSSAEHRNLPASVRLYEPRSALVGGWDGLGPTAIILSGARHHLLPGGLLALEVDATRATRSLSLAREAGWAAPRVVEDLFGRPRYLLAIMESD